MSIFRTHQPKTSLFLNSTLAASVVLACGIAEADSKIEIDSDYVNTSLQWAPAESFLVIGNTQSFGSEQGKNFAGRYQKLYSQIGSTYSKLIEGVLQNDMAEMPEEMQGVFKGYMSLVETMIELLQNDSAWENVEAGNSAMYLDGIIPVIRSEGMSKEIIKFFQSAIDEKLPTPEKITRDGVEILKYKLPSEDMPFTVAVYYSLGESHTVLSVFPEDFEDYYLQRNFVKPVEDSVWSSGELVKVRDEYGFNGLSEGYLNLERLVDTVLRKKGDKVEDPILQMAMLMVPSLEQISPPGCGAVVEKVIESVPRLVMGYENSSEVSDVMSMTLEFSPEVAAGIQEISEDIPATQNIEDSIFEVGVGINLLNLRDSINTVVGFLQEEGEDCVLIDQEEIQQSLVGLNLAMNPMVTQFTGVNVALSSFAFPEEGDEPDLSKIEGVAIFNVEDTDSLMQFAPMLGIDLDVPADGTAVELPEGLLPPEAPEGILIARTQNQIALGAGAKAEELIAAAFSDKEEDKDMLIRYAVDFDDIVKLLPMELMEQAFMKESETDDAGIFAEIIKMYQVIDKISTGIGFSEKGLKVTAEQSFNL